MDRSNLWDDYKSFGSFAKWSNGISIAKCGRLDRCIRAKKYSFPFSSNKGLCLSGCENENENQELCELLKAKHPDLCSHYRIASDTIGSIMTCSPEGGIVLIAGTGSNSLLIYPDGSTFRCGGWGHLIGDMGSAYWIAIRMIKCLIENAENYTPIHYDTSEAEKILFDYFKVRKSLSVPFRI